MRIFLVSAASALLLSSFAFGCGGNKNAPNKVEYTGPISAKTSTSAQREKVGITVYNGDFGLVRETRTIDLGKGRVALDFDDVAEHIQPETVSIKSLSSPGALSVFEQNYRYDLLSPQKLLEKYVGKSVTLHRYNEKLGTEEDFPAKVVAFNEGTPIFQMQNGEITYGFPGRISFPNVPPNLIAKPTLVWLLGSGEARQKVEVAYITQGMSWKADYVLTIDQANTVGQLVGWVTLSNRSGAEYDDAELQLVAGDVQRVTPQEVYKDLEERSRSEDDRGGRFREEGFFEYHLYTLDRPTTLLQNEQKQVSLLTADDVGIHERLVFVGNQAYFRSQYGEIAQNQKVGVFLEMQNSEANHMGMALPKGIVRVYKADSSGQKQFIGEDQIDHTPRDEKLRIKMGDAFDVVGDRKQMAWRSLGVCTSESDFEISLRNHKDTDVEIEDVEPTGGDWNVTRSSDQAQRKDAFTFFFDVKVPARGEKKITYTVRIRWC
jgi:hypothetical protein